jgi:pimeloyl-ACP methyl ester carboxylesterase
MIPSVLRASRVIVGTLLLLALIAPAANAHDFEITIDGHTRSSRRFHTSHRYDVAPRELPGVREGDQNLPSGVIVDEVQCAGDPAQTYALYIPSRYSGDRTWSLLIGLHPAARGRAMVEKYVAPADRYGYIVAGSNASRNGPLAVSLAALQAMLRDLGSRFAIDPQRVYLTGLSGGARVALQVALAGNDIAGVIASSAGYPDSEPRASVAFPLFATTGTEDFNYVEMRRLDRKLTSAHFLAIFNGGHALPPDDVAMDAIEWMELQAIKSGRRGKDDALVDRLLEKRRAQIAASTETARTVYLLDAIVSDFKGFRDVSVEENRAREMSKGRDVKKALSQDRAAIDSEERMLEEIYSVEAGLRDETRHDVSLGILRDRLSNLARKAGSNVDSADRRQARRVLRAVSVGAPARVQDRAYLAAIEQYARPSR